MSFDLPFLTKAQKQASKLQATRREPWGGEAEPHGFVPPTTPYPDIVSAAAPPVPPDFNAMRSTLPTDWSDQTRTSDQVPDWAQNMFRPGSIAPPPSPISPEMEELLRTDMAAPGMGALGARSLLSPSPAATEVPIAQPTMPDDLKMAVRRHWAEEDYLRTGMTMGQSPFFDPYLGGISPRVTQEGREAEITRVRMDWQKSREALERSQDRTVLATIQPVLDALDIGSAYFGGTLVDAWNKFKAASGGNFTPVLESWDYLTEPQQVSTWDAGFTGMEQVHGMAPDFRQGDMGIADHIRRVVGTERDKMQEIAHRQQERSGWVRFASEILMPFEAGAAATLVSTGFKIVRVLTNPRIALAAAPLARDAVVKTTAAARDFPSWMWNDARQWEQKWRKDGGIVIPNTMAQAQLEEFGFIPHQDANVFAGPLRGIKDVMSSVVTTDNAMTRFALKVTGINPSVNLASISPIGKLLIARNMQKIAAEELINVALQGTYDRHSAVSIKRFIGRGSPLKPISNEGMYGNTGVVWQKVFEHVAGGPSEWGERMMVSPTITASEWAERMRHAKKYDLSPEEYLLMDDFNSVTNIEVPRMLDEVGITIAERADKDGPWYVPRDVVEILDLVDEVKTDFKKIRNDPTLSRHYEDIMDGVEAGIRYNTSPRDSLQIYLRWAYGKIIDKQFMDAMEELGLSHTKSELLSPDIVRRYNDMVDMNKHLKTKLNRVKGAILTAKNQEKVAAASFAGRQQARRVTAQDIDMLDQFIQTTTFPGIGPTPGEVIKARVKTTGESLRVQEQSVKKLENQLKTIDNEIQFAEGLEKGNERSMVIFQNLYNSLEDTLDMLAIAPHMSADEIRQAFKNPKAFRAAVQEGKSVTEIKPDPRQLGKYFQTKYFMRQVDPKLQTASRRFSNSEAALEELDDLRLSAQNTLDVARADLDLASKAYRAEKAVEARAFRSQMRREGTQAFANQQLKRNKKRSETNQNKVRTAADNLDDLRFRRVMLEDIRDALVAQQKELKDRRAEVYKDMWNERARFQSNRTALADGALWGKHQDGQITIQQWRNRWLPHADANLITEYFKNNQAALISPSATLGKLTSLANSIRFLSAIGDFAMPFIQGQLILATNPGAWAKMTFSHYQAWFDPSVQARLVAQNLSDYQELARLGVPVGDPEFFSVMQTGAGGVSPGAFLENRYVNLPKIREGGRFLIGQNVFGRFQASYNAGLGHARVLLYQGAKEHWTGTQAELGQYIRNLTGGLDSRALGVTPGQRLAENLWLAFSPRLLRSTMAIIANGILRPNTVQGRRSLRTLASWIAGTHGIYILSGMAMGKSLDDMQDGLNPLSGKRYLSHQINGDWIGVGGQVRAAMQLIGAGVLGSYGDPKGLLEPSLQDNPLLRSVFSFIEGRGAVGRSIVGGAVEAATHGSINALPFDRIDGGADYGKHLATSALPFTIQGAMEGEQTRTSIMSMLGLRTSAETPSDARNAARAVEIERRFPGENREWDSFNLADKADLDDAVEEQNPGTRQEVREMYNRFGSDEAIYLGARADISDTYINNVTDLWDSAYDDGKYPFGRPFRERVGYYRGERGKSIAALMERGKPRIRGTDPQGQKVLIDNPSFDPSIKSALEDLEDRDPSEHQFDLALGDYINSMYGDGSPTAKETENLSYYSGSDAEPELDVAELWGEFDYEEHEQREEAFIAQWGNEMFKKIRDFLTRDDPPAVKLLDADREVLAQAGYWRVNDLVALGKPSYIQQGWQRYLDEPHPSIKKSIIAEYDHPQAETGNIIRDLIKARDEMRLDMREINPEITGILLRHGYGIQQPKDWEGVVPWMEYARITNEDAWKAAYQGLATPN